MKTAQTGQPTPLLHCPHGLRLFPHIASEPFLFQLMPVVSYPPSMPHCAGTGSTSLMPPCRHLVCLFSPPQFILAPDWTSTAPSASPHRASASVPHHRGDDQLNSLTVMSLCLGLGTQNCLPSFLQYPHRMRQTPRKWKSPLQHRLPFVEPAPKPHLSVPKRASTYWCSRMGRCVLCSYTWPMQLGVEG